MTAADESAWLIPLPGGPPLHPIELKWSNSPLILGRHEHCSIRLPSDADQVSRQHARFTRAGGQWRISDLRSRWGTFLNGAKMPPLRESVLDDGDLLRIVPWTFTFSTRGVPAKGLHAVEDTASMTAIRSHAPGSATEPLADDLLNLLVEAASAIHAAEDEKELIERLIEFAVRGTGLSNAAVVRPLDSSGRIEIVASRMSSFAADSPSPAGFSKSLLTVASGGNVAEISATNVGDISQSIIQMKVDAAICAPLMLGSAVSAYLYLDSRGASSALRLLRPNAAGFCSALAKMAGLAMANLKRVEMERRSAQMEIELNAATVAQKWILPGKAVQSGPFTCAGSSRPGEYVGGDFFDSIPLSNDRLAVALGDVSGHGIAASILMTACQGFFHAAISNHGDLARAVRDLNAFVHPRKPETRFVTFWAGIFDAREMSVTYIDAGHGYAVLQMPGRECQMLAGGDAFPLGITSDAIYSAITHQLPARGRALIISDGFIEQTPAEPTAGQPREQFGMHRVQQILSACQPEIDAVAELFKSIHDFAGSEHLADDATAALVQW